MPTPLDRTDSLILRSTRTTPMSPGQLARTFGVPVVECWRRVRALERRGLLRLIVVASMGDGRTLRFFRADLAAEEIVDLVR